MQFDNYCRRELPRAVMRHFELIACEFYSQTIVEDLKPLLESVAKNSYNEVTSSFQRTQQPLTATAAVVQSGTSDATNTALEYLSTMSEVQPELPFLFPLISSDDVQSEPVQQEYVEEITQFNLPDLNISLGHQQNSNSLENYQGMESIDYNDVLYESLGLPEMPLLHPEDLSIEQGPNLAYTPIDVYMPEDDSPSSYAIHDQGRMEARNCNPALQDYATSYYLGDAVPYIPDDFVASEFEKLDYNTASGMDGETWS